MYEIKGFNVHYKKRPGFNFAIFLNGNLWTCIFDSKFHYFTTNTGQGALTTTPVAVLADVATRNGLSINTKLLQGNPSSAILDFCEKEKYDILVMGSRGMGKFKELVLGSVSSKVLHHSSCPVMIIRLYGINQFRFYSEFD